MSSTLRQRRGGGAASIPKHLRKGETESEEKEAAPAVVEPVYSAVPGIASARQHAPDGDWLERNEPIVHWIVLALAAFSRFYRLDRPCVQLEWGGMRRVPVGAACIYESAASWAPPARAQPPPGTAPPPFYPRRPGVVFDETHFGRFTNQYSACKVPAVGRHCSGALCTYPAHSALTQAPPHRARLPPPSILQCATSTFSTSTRRWAS